MHLDKSILKEEAYTGEELLQDGGFSPLDRKCLVIRQTVTDGVFTLEEALVAYGVTEEDFNKYLTKHLVSELNVFLSHSSSLHAVTFSITVIGEMYKQLLAGVDKEAQVVHDHLLLLSKDISSGKIAV
jgi:hypothetical protein